MRRLLTALLLLTLFAGCAKDEPVQPGDLYGLWKFQGYGSHLAYVALPEPRDIWRNKNSFTLRLDNQGARIRFSGQMAINSYTGTFLRGAAIARFVGYRADSVLVAVTEKAGPAADLLREEAYFAQLRQLTGLYLYRPSYDNYDQLLWMTSETEYLSFVRRR